MDDARVTRKRGPQGKMLDVGGREGREGRDRRGGSNE